MKHSMIWLAGSLAIGATFLSGCKSSGDQASNSGETAKTTTGGAAAATGDRPMPTEKGATVGANDPIKLGIVASLTGDQKPWGDDSYAGAQMAVEEINAKGGIKGHKVNLIVADSASKAEAAKTAAEKLIGEGVVGILGEVASGLTEQIARSAFEKGVPVIAVGATKTKLTEPFGNVFRVCYVDAFQGPVMAKFAFEEQGVKTIAIITDKKLPYSTGLSDDFKQYFEKLGGKVVKEVFYQSGDTQFSSQLEELKQAAPQGILMSGYFSEVGPLASAIKSAGIKAKLFGGDGWDSEQILQSGGDGIIGGFMCNHYNNKETRPEVAAFLKKWEGAHGGKDPGTTMAALGYDAAALAVDALSRCATLDSPTLIKAIEDTENFNGVTGKISLKGHRGNPPKRALVVEVRPMSEGFQVPRKAYEYFDSSK